MIVGYECEGISWNWGAANATQCYELTMGDDDCGKRFMTYNSANSGCACYPVDMAVCNVLNRAARLTWDFEPVSSSFDGLLIDTSKPFNVGTALPFKDRRCPNIMWKTVAGDASHCLQKIVEGDYDDCGRNFITWNSANGGCACYAPEQTCTRAESVGESGRQTFEIEVDPSYEEPTTCEEPSGKVEITFWSKTKFNTCKWFAGHSKFNCDKKPVRESCPVSCGECDTAPCEDPKGKVEVFFGTKRKFKTCNWYFKHKKFNCSRKPVQEACPAICEMCS